jgi:hypothetical protein
MQKLINLIKRYKAPLVILVGILGLLIFLLITQVKEGIKLSPVKVVEQPYPTDASGTLTLLEAIPPSGEQRQSPDTTEYIELRFSAPIDVDTLKMRIRPYINLKATVYKEEPNILWLIPNQTSWENKTQYEIVITSLGGLSGEKLQRVIQYSYYNNPPEHIEAVGEGIFHH